MSIGSIPVSAAWWLSSSGLDSFLLAYGVLHTLLKVHRSTTLTCAH